MYLKFNMYETLDSRHIWNIKLKTTVPDPKGLCHSGESAWVTGKHSWLEIRRSGCLRSPRQRSQPNQLRFSCFQMSIFPTLESVKK